MEEELDATRIRELLLDFYSTHDPQRLNMGLDIFSMVVWTQQNGIDALNELLEEQYGVKIDPDKQLGGTKASFKRFSVLMGGGDSEDEATKRKHVYDKLLEFYEAHDPSKIGRLNDFVQYIMLHGMEAFNRKLYAKYGEGITLDEDVGRPASPRSGSFNGASESGFTISTEQSSSSYQRGGAQSPRAAPEAPPRKVAPKAPPKAPKKKSSAAAAAADVDDLDIPPPPPLSGTFDSAAPPASRREALKLKLKGYYAMHDPGKLDHVDSIVEWGLQIGEAELESKLIQIYGNGFNATGAAKPEPAEKKKKPSQAPSASVAGLLRRSLQLSGNRNKGPASPKPVVRKEAPKKPVPPPGIGGGGLFGRGGGGKKKPVMPKAPKWAPPSNVVGMPPPDAERPTAAARQKSMTEEDIPCDYYELDMTGATFGVCKCGFSRQAHRKHSPEHQRGAAFKVGTARSIAGEVRSRNGSTDTFRSGTSQQRRADVVAGAGEKGGDGPCNNFRLDMTGQSYGVCECGFKRDQHDYLSQLDEMDSQRSGAKGALRRSMNRVSKRLFSR